MKITGWILAAIAVAALVYLQICNSPKPVKISDEVYNALKKETIDTAAYYEQLLKADDAATELAVTHAEEAYKNQHVAETNLKASNSQVSNLTVELRTIRKQMRNTDPDSGNWVAVSPKYVSTCDSLEVAADKHVLETISYMTSNDILKEKVTQLESTYKEKLKTQANFNNALRTQLDNCLLTVKNNPGNKRSQVYGGVNIMGNKTYFIDGGQINLTLLTKRNSMFEVNGALIHGELYVGAGTKFLISFRRK